MARFASSVRKYLQNTFQHLLYQWESWLVMRRTRSNRLKGKHDSLQRTGFTCLVWIKWNPFIYECVVFLVILLHWLNQVSYWRGWPATVPDKFSTTNEMESCISSVFKKLCCLNSLYCIEYTLDHYTLLYCTAKCFSNSYHINKQLISLLQELEALSQHTLTNLMFALFQRVP